MLKLKVANTWYETDDIRVIELTTTDGSPLPAFSAGAHIDLHVPGPHVRQYSLCNGPEETTVYRIAVLRAAQSRGGSAAVHDAINIGDVVETGHPRNLFEIEDRTVPHLLFAGGIGITPILAMAEDLSKAGTPFELHYCSRSEEKTAFLPLLQSRPFARAVTTHFDNGEADQALDLQSTLAGAPQNAQLYVCGPTGFMDLVLDTARSLGWNEGRLHKEYFSAPPAIFDEGGAFQIVLNSTGQTLQVPADKTALEVMLANGIDIPVSCEQGICGTCLTRILQGVPEHRDAYQTEEEQALNDYFTPCCSRSKTPVLVLDL